MKVKKTAAIISLASILMTLTPAYAAQNSTEALRKSQWADSPKAVSPYVASNSTGAQQSTVVPKVTNDFASDRIIVKYKAGLSRTQGMSVSALSQNSISSIKPLGNDIDLLTLASGSNLETVISKLEKDPSVEYAEPDYKVYPNTYGASGELTTTKPGISASKKDTTSGTKALTSKTSATANSSEVNSSDTNPSAAVSSPNDEFFGEQWALNNTGQRLANGFYEGGTPGIDIDALNAWSITKGSSDTVVAVIDTGVQIEHQDLVGSIWTNKQEIPGDGIDNDGDGYIDDINGWDFVHSDNSLYDYRDQDSDYHGTSLAGIISAMHNNGWGMSGVAPDAKVMPLKFMSKNDGGYISAAVEAIHYAEDHGAQMALITWRGPDSRALREAIENSNMLFIIAAGDDRANFNSDIYKVYPAAYNFPNILTVTSIDNKGNLAPGAAFGSASVDIAAPGQHVLATVPDNIVGYGAEINNGTFKVIYNGIGYENLPSTGVYSTQAQDMFNRAMDYLKPEDGSTPKVLLVQDNKAGEFSGPMIAESDSEDAELEVYKNLLTKAGYAYDLVTLDDQTVDGPDTAQLDQYDIVIWFSGIVDSYSAEEGILKPADQEHLSSFLDDGGHLLLSGLNIIDDIYESSFVQDKLHLIYMADGSIGDAVGVAGTAYQDTSYKTYDVQIFTTNVASEDQSITRINLWTPDVPYWLRENTGMAAAVAAGAAALVVSQNPDMDASDIRQRLLNSGTPLPSLNGITATGKMINAFNALRDDEIPGVPLQDVSVKDRLNAASKTDKVYAVSLIKGEQIRLNLSGDAGTDFDLYLYDPSSETVAGKSGQVAHSENKKTSTEAITYTAAETGTYYIDVYAFAGAGQFVLNVQHSNQNGTFEDSSSSLVYTGNWSKLTSSTYSGGTQRQIDAKGSVEFGFQGNYIEWIGSKNNLQGIADIFIDGVKTDSISLYRDKALNQQVLYKKLLTPGHHSIKVVWTGKPDRSAPKSGPSAINVDAFKVANVIRPDSVYAVYTGPWTSGYGLKFTAGVQTYTPDAGSAAQFTFKGNQATIISSTGSNRGMMDVYIDGKKVNTNPVDLYSKETKYGVPVFVSPILDQGNHTIKIVNSGGQNPASTGSLITLDSIQVQNLEL